MTIPSREAFIQALADELLLERVAGEHRLVADVGLDSLGFVELMALATQMGSDREFPEDFDFVDVTVDDAYYYLFELSRGSGSAGAS